MKFILFVFVINELQLLLIDDFAKNEKKRSNLNFKFLAHHIWNEYLKMNNKIRLHIWKIFLLAKKKNYTAMTFKTRGRVSDKCSSCRLQFQENSPKMIYAHSSFLSKKNTTKNV